MKKIPVGAQAKLMPNAAYELPAERSKIPEIVRGILKTSVLRTLLSFGFDHCLFV